MFSRLYRLSALIQSKQHGFLLLSSLLCGCLLIALYFAIVSLHSDIKLASKPITPTQKAKPMDDKTLALIAALPNAHLFGQKPLVSDYIPITSLSLHLTGIIKMEEGVSKAIISDADKTGRVYGVGDKLPEGISVYAIDNTGVVLENVGHLEKLPLLRPTLSFQPPPQSMLAKS